MDYTWHLLFKNPISIYQLHDVAEELEFISVRPGHEYRDSTVLPVNTVRRRISFTLRNWRDAENLKSEYMFEGGVYVSRDDAPQEFTLHPYRSSIMLSAPQEEDPYIAMRETTLGLARFLPIAALRGNLLGVLPRELNTQAIVLTFTPSIFEYLETPPIDVCV